MIERNPRAPALRSMAFPEIAPRASRGQRKLDVLHLEQPLILLDQRILGFDQDARERRLVEVSARGGTARWHARLSVGWQTTSHPAQARSAL
jgi:hypothetical protein